MSTCVTGPFCQGTSSESEKGASVKELFLAILILFVPGNVAPVFSAPPVEKTIVYIECTTSDKTVLHGSGVVVSPQGHVLTALHIAPDNAVCRGSIGVADPQSLRNMVRQPISTGVDATLLRFSLPGAYDYAQFCPLEDWMVRKDIFVSGFPDNTGTGTPSFRRGVLATVLPDSSGFLESDAQTIRGMSGGPVFSKNFAGIIGIVAGARFDGSGAVSSYEILSAEFFAKLLGLTKSEIPCFHETREVTLPAEMQHWKAGDPPLNLGVRVDEGMCFLASIWGQFTNTSDTVVVSAREDGFYYLDGTSNASGLRGGAARCFWYD
ncbi:conserved hypothetical protein [Mesorhizobium plurifarium]|uniref:Serine protease n=1 Tax=Mesorhizobium plurifarium TaxID=69974 RepID=A0A090G7J3_MESPL|nr:conserved hypothetical protein [Mesorhizobium plurifarium]